MVNFLTYVMLLNIVLIIYSSVLIICLSVLLLQAYVGTYTFLLMHPSMKNEHSLHDMQNATIVVVVVVVVNSCISDKS